MASFEAKFDFGIRGKDVVTGFEGIITGLARDMTGSDQYLLSAESKENKEPERIWFDENRLERVGSSKIVLPDTKKEKKPGADVSAPAK